MVFLIAGCISTGAAQSTTSQGKDFWLMFNENYTGGATLTLFITSDVNTSGSVSGASFSSIPFTVTANTVTSVVVPSALANHTSNVVDNKGIHVTSLQDVTVYGLNLLQFSTDAYLGLPTDVLGKDYLVTTYTSIGFGNMFGIVGTVNNTTVTITPSSTVGARTAGVPYNITLNQGETYELMQTNPSSDLTGSRITSTQPVAVIGAGQCSNIPIGYSFCDHINEMMPPTTTWGKKFGAVPLKSRANGDTWRFMASANGTTVSINGIAQSPVLNAGQFIERTLTAASIVEADKPILTTQYSNGSQFSGNPGDPFMMLIPPLEQFLGDYTIINVSGYTDQFINIIAPNAIVGAITLDAVLIPSASFTPIGASGYSWAQITTTTGTHNLSANQPFGVFVYGFNTDDSYGYPGGQSFAPIATATSIAITPKTGAGATGISRCWDALVKDQNGNPLTGIVVNFNIRGTNPGSTGFATTNALGIAHFCYSGPNAGLDSIIASLGTLRDTAMFTWTSVAGCTMNIINCPQDITLLTQPNSNTCSRTATWTPPIDSNNCPGTTVASTHLPGATFQVGTTTVTYTFINGADTNRCSFTVSVLDSTAPVIAQAGNITVACDANGCGKIVNYPTPTFTDNCPTCFPAVPSNYTYLGSFNGHTYFKSSSAADWNNFETFALNIGGYLTTISSAAENAFVAAAAGEPVWTGLSDKNTEGIFQWSNGEPVTYTNWCGAQPNNAGNQDYVAMNIGAGGCWDDLHSCCLPAVLEFNCNPFAERIAGPASGSLFPIGTTTITYKATDPSGNTALMSFTVTVNDSTAPVFAAVNNVTTVCDSNGCTAVVHYPTPTFSDNCPNCVPVVPPGYLYLGSFNGHTYYKSPSAADWNNFESFAFTIGGYLTTINNAAEDSFLSAVAGGAAWIGLTDKYDEGNFQWSNGEPVTYTNWCTAQPDNGGNSDYTAINIGAGGCWDDFQSCCLPAIIEFNCNPFAERVAGPPSGGTFPTGTTVVTYKATDPSGNIAMTSFTVTVKDSTPPVFAPVSNITVAGNPATCGAIVNYPTPGFTDNCPTCFPSVPANYVFLGSFNGHTYYKSPTAADWNNFETFALNLGGYLTTVNSAAENAFLSNAVGSGAWIGLTDKNAEGVFQWSNGEAVTYTNWCAAQPDNGGNSDYAALNAGIGGCWNDFQSCCLPAIIEFNCNPFPERIAGPASGSFFPVGVTTVTYRIIDPSGNISTVSFTVTVTDSTHTCTPVNNRQILANNTSTTPEVRIYPNPNNGSFIVQLPYTEDHTQISVTDVQGKLISRKVVSHPDGEQIRFDLGDVAKGMYLVEVIYGDNRFRAKLVVQ
jgi:hypothetical protein